MISWNVTSCSVLHAQNFGRTCCLQLQGRKTWGFIYWYKRIEGTSCLLVQNIRRVVSKVDIGVSVETAAPIFRSNLLNGEVGSSETSVPVHSTTLRHVPEHHNLHFYPAFCDMDGQAGLLIRRQ